MIYYVIKLIVTLILILLISEIGKHNTFFSALLASLPIVSIISILWIYIDTNDTTSIIKFSNSILWLILPSLVFFIILPILLKFQIHFSYSLFISCIMTLFSYYLLIIVLKYFGIKL